MTPLVVGTRGSDLALWQARWVAARLEAAGHAARLEIVRTAGDRAIDLDLAGSVERGLFTRDIEEALGEGRVDLAVHSLKDLPTRLPEGLALGAVPQRAAVADVLLVRPDALDGGAGALPLRQGARVGTGSPRRQALLRWLRPDLVTGPFRGNVPTRVRKCVDGDVDAVVLARAGLDRLALDVTPLVAFELDPAAWLPAPAQGALGVEVRAGDARVQGAVAALQHAASAAAVGLERELLAVLEAGCHAALGAWARVEDGTARLDCGALGEDGAWRRVTLDDAGAAGKAAEAARRLASEPPSRPPEMPVAVPWRRDP